MLSRPMAAAAAVLLSLCAADVTVAGPADAAGGAQLAQGRSGQTAEPAAGTFISGLADQAIAGLADKSLSTAQRTERFRTLLTTDFDMPAIARLRSSGSVAYALIMLAKEVSPPDGGTSTEYSTLARGGAGI